MKPRVPLILEAISNGEVIITDREWVPSDAFWCDWGIITEAREDGTILGTTVSGKGRRMSFVGGYCPVLSRSKARMTVEQALLAALKGQALFLVEIERGIQSAAK